jgi:UDPglucose 6-dehydrogenase
LDSLRKDRISFIGLGKLGLPLACCFANAGLKVICIDKNQSLLSSLRNSELPFFESGLSNLFASSTNNFIDFTDSFETAINDADVTIILVNTQLGADGYSSEIVEDVIIKLSRALKMSEKKYHQIILSSTVPPGTISDLINKIEQITERVIGTDFGFSYVPDFVKLGSVISDFRNPDFCLIGANSQIDFEITSEMWALIHQNKPKITNLTLEETEIAKIALNAYIVNKISFANHLGLLCAGMSNVDVHRITRAIGQDPRISPFFFSAGTPYGGTCFPRDATAYISFGKKRGTPAGNLEFAEAINHKLLNHLMTQLTPFSKIGVIGVTFKPGSAVTVDSASVSLILALAKMGKEVFIYDHLYQEIENLDQYCQVCLQPQECIDRSEVVILMHPGSDFSKLNYIGKTVIDPWGVFTVVS